MAEEKVLTINFRDGLLKYPKWKRSERLVRLVKNKISRITKNDNVKIDQELNKMIWSKGASGAPKKLKIKISKEGESFIVKPA